MVFTNARPFPYIVGSASNITPFTYTDGTTYLSQLEQMREWLNTELVPSFNAGITNAIAEYQNGLGNAEAYVDEMIQYINNKTGDVEVQRYTLTGPFTMSVDPQWPNNHLVNVVLKQDATGNRAVTLAGNISGSVVVDPAPNAVIEFTLIPVGDGTWKVFQFTAIKAAIDSEIDALAGELAGTDAAVDAHNARLGIIETTLPSKADKAKTVPLVTSYAELVAAVATGGTIRVSNTPITLTGEVILNTPARIEGGVFNLPTDAGYAAFKVTTSNVSFNGCTFTGGGTDKNFNSETRFIRAAGAGSSYLRNVNVTNCRFTGSQSDNIRFEYVRDSVVANNSIDNFLYSGVMLISVEDSTVSSNVITNAVMKAPVVNVYGIAATDIDNTVATRSRNVKIIGNTIRNVEWEGIDTHGGEAIVIQGNTIESCGRGIALVVGNSDRLTSPTNCVVTGNYVDKGTNTTPGREGISLYGLSSNFATAVITGNTVRGHEAGKEITLSQYDARRTLVEGNSHPMVPWTPVNMDNGVQWGGSASFPPEYMIDGRTVYLRGMVTPAGTQTTALQRIGGVPTVARPGALTFYKQTRGANTLSSTHATLAANPDGAIEMYYRNNTNDFYSYPIDGSYQRDYLGAL